MSFFCAVFALSSVLFYCASLCVLPLTFTYQFIHITHALLKMKNLKWIDPCILESVSGNCKHYTMTTMLKMGSELARSTYVTVTITPVQYCYIVLEAIQTSFVLASVTGHLLGLFSLQMQWTLIPLVDRHFHRWFSTKLCTKSNILCTEIIDYNLWH